MSNTQLTSRIRFSPCDSDLLSRRWQISRDGYACTQERPKPKSQRRHVSAHRIVLARMIDRELTPSDICDHINGDRLDNRRENLRLTNRCGNSQNRRPMSACGIRGVTFHKGTNKWQAAVKHADKNHYCGLFATPEEAGAAAEEKRVELSFLGGAA